jgi:hypothetical protein
MLKSKNHELLPQAQAQAQQRALPFAERDLLAERMKALSVSSLSFLSSPLFEVPRPDITQQADRQP